MALPLIVIRCDLNVLGNGSGESQKYFKSILVSFCREKVFVFLNRLLNPSKVRREQNFHSRKEEGLFLLYKKNCMDNIKRKPGRGVSSVW